MNAVTSLAIGLTAPSTAPAQTTTRVNVTTGGAQAEYGSWHHAISGDGRYVSFTSHATNLVAGDTNGWDDVFVHDRVTGVTTRVSVGTGGGQANRESRNSAISADGRYVAFTSDASNLVAGDTNGEFDVFVHDRQTGETTRASVATGGGQTLPTSGWGSFLSDLSGDGRYVAFTSDASNLVAGDTNGAPDVFVHDRVTGVTSRVSVASGGVQADLGGGSGSLSDDGRYVAFTSDATNLVAGDTNGRSDVFVHDRLTGVTSRVNVPAWMDQANDHSFTPRLSADGRIVAFVSGAINMTIGDTNNTWDVFAYDRLTRTTTRVSVGAGGLQSNARSGGPPDFCPPALSADGRHVVFTSEASNLVAADTNGVLDVFVHDRLTGTTARVSVGSGGVQGNAWSPCADVSADGRYVSFLSDASNLVAGDTGPHRDVFVHDLDADGDSLPAWWETAFGLNPLAGAGDQGASGDVDADGQTNAEEYAAGTHPRGLYTRYLAEGATPMLFFDTRLAVLNPATSPASVLLRFMKPDGSTTALLVPVSAMARATVDVKTQAGLPNVEFSTVVESDSEVVVDRTITWDAGTPYGGHAETSVASPALTWHLAEGATHSGFNLFYLLQNPNATEAQVRVRYLRPADTPLEKTYTLLPTSRTNIWVDVEDFGGQALLASTDVSAVFEVLNSQPIIVERAMYFEVPGQTLGAGHGSAGITEPALEWFLAEGATGPFFDLFVLVANPGGLEARVEATYLLPDGTRVVKPYTVAASSRFNIWVDYEDPRLANTAVSTTIRSTNGVPVVVERAMWWPDGGWYEGHNSRGATTTGTKWALAEGEADAARNLETYILVANTSATPADVKVTLLFEGGGSAEQTYTGIPAHSRFNVPVGWFFPQAAGRRFGAIVESLGTTPAQIVVERAMYWDAAGQRWAAGTNALATIIQ